MKKFVVLSVVSAFILYQWQVFIPEHWYTDGTKDIDDFLHDHGYPLEKHETITEDGYILTLHRIPNGRNEAPKNDNGDKKPPVFIMHGLLCSSMDWVILGPGKAMALILADAGYDVWLGNNRGNTYSRKHISLDPDMDGKKFWTYSYHEIGTYDIPAMIDTVLNTTGFEKLTYLGYSEGFTSFTVMGSIRPEYNDKILIMNAFAPVTNMYKIKSIPINLLAKFPVLNMAQSIQWNEMFSHRKTSHIARLMCHFLKPICRAIFKIVGFSEGQIDQDFLNTILANFPAGMSLKQIQHYVQGTTTGLYRPFDYGSDTNLEVYNSTQPPPYDLTKITAPVILYYGEDDYLVNNDILLNSVAKEMPNIVDQYLVPYKNLNHLDFIWGSHISLLTSKALENINKYNNKG